MLEWVSDLSAKPDKIRIKSVSADTSQGGGEMVVPWKPQNQTDINIFFCAPMMLFAICCYFLLG